MGKAVRQNRAVILSAALGGLLFLCIYGIHVLDPGYDDWLISGGDRAQHYLGWVGYRNAPWGLPLGMTPNLVYPYPVSIIFTDSIPLMAIFFKLLSPLLPDVFQYFGLWGLLCFALNGAVSAKILLRYLKSEAAVLLGSAFFILSFQVISRLFVHTSLASHWLILLAVLAFIYHDAWFERTKNGVLYWAGLAFLCSTIHLYFIPMCGIILLGFCLLDFLKTKKIGRPLLFTGSYIAVAFVVLLLLGGFTGEISYLTSTLGDFSFNLNGFFDSMDTGFFLPALPSFPDQYEGYAYLGVGMFTLLALTLLNLFRALIRRRAHGPQPVTAPKAPTAQPVSARDYPAQDSPAPASLHGQAPLFLCSGLICLAALIVAASFRVTWGQHILFEYHVPQVLLKIWDAFRSSGRFAWICVYFLFLFAICADVRVCPRRVKTLLLALCLSLQLVDISPLLLERHGWFSSVLTFENPAFSGQWDSLPQNSRLRHLLIYPQLSWDNLKSFAELALKNDWTINQFYMARVDADIRSESLTHFLRPQEDTLYVWEAGSTLACADPRLYYYAIDGYIAGSMTPLAGLTALSPDDERLGRCRSVFLDNANLAGGYDESGVRHLEPDGASYGPYAYAPAGDYRVTIHGENLAGNTFLSYSDGGAIRYELLRLQESPAEVTFEIHLPDGVSNLEIEIHNTNPGQAEVLLTELLIETLSLAASAPEAEP